MVDHPPSSPPPSSPPLGSTRWLRLFAWDARPEVEVRHGDGLWYRGRLRAWRRDDASGWRAMVTYHVAIGRQHYREVPAADVRRAAPRDPREPAPSASGTWTEEHDDEGVGVDLAMGGLG